MCDFIIDPVMGIRVMLGVELDDFQAYCIRIMHFVQNVMDCSGFSTGKSLRDFCYQNYRALTNTTFQWVTFSPPPDAESLRVYAELMTMFDNRTNLSQEVVDEVRKHFKKQVFTTIIPRSVRLAEAPSYGMPILSYFPSSPGAEAHRALAEEVLEQDGVKVAVEA